MPDGMLELSVFSPPCNSHDSTFSFHLQYSVYSTWVWMRHHMPGRRRWAAFHSLPWGKSGTKQVAEEDDFDSLLNTIWQASCLRSLQGMHALAMAQQCHSMVQHWCNTPPNFDSSRSIVPCNKQIMLLHLQCCLCAISVHASEPNQAV